MFDDPVTFLLLSTGRLPALLFALSLHEAAHAWMALKCGDDTAARMGRITLNPLAHLDPVGTIGLVIGFIGWGKPVPFVERNLRHPLRDAMYIAAAGPASNLLLAAVSGVLFRLLLPMAHLEPWGMPPGATEDVLSRIILFGLFLVTFSLVVNLMLCFFNLIPIFPLDGEKILAGLLPYRQAYQLAQLRQYGPMLLLALILFGGPFVLKWMEVMTKPFFYLFGGISYEEAEVVIGLSFRALWGN